MHTYDSVAALYLLAAGCMTKTFYNRKAKT